MKGGCAARGVFAGRLADVESGSGTSCGCGVHEALMRGGHFNWLSPMAARLYKSSRFVELDSKTRTSPGILGRKAKRKARAFPPRCAKLWPTMYPPVATKDPTAVEV